MIRRCASTLPFPVVAGVLAALVVAGATFGADGELDPDFGDGGRVVENIDTLYPSALEVVVPHPAGGVVAAGFIDGASTPSQPLVVRLDAAGRIDPTFGAGGTVAFDPAALGGGGVVTDLAVGPGGTLFVLVDGSSGDLVVGVDASGSPLAGFGTGGTVVLPTGVSERYERVAVGSDGSVVVGGEDGTAASVLRYTSAGVPDTTFDSDGRVRIELPDNTDVTALAVLDDGSTLVVARAASGTGSGWATVVARLDPSGAYDTSFGGGDGVAEPGFDGPDRSDVMTSVRVLDDDSFLLAGSVADDLEPEGDLLVARFAADGSLDETFGSGGSTRWPGGNVPVPGNGRSGVDVFDDGTIVATVEVQSGDAVLIAVDATGSVVSSFGVGGDAGPPPGFGQGEQSTYSDVVVTGSGASQKVTAVGVVQRFGFDVVEAFAASFTGTGVADTGFGDDGSTQVTVGPGIGGPELMVSAFERPDGTIITVGLEQGSDRYETRISRYLADGTLDTTFGEDGHVVHTDGVSIPTAARIDSQGRIVVVGFPVSLDGTEVRRYLPTGAVDTEFGVDGEASVGTFGFGAILLAQFGEFEIDSEDRIVIAGSVEGDGDGDADVVPVVERLGADGLPDESFGSGGAARIDVAGTGPDAVFATDVAIDDTGRLVVGLSSYPSGGFGVVRLLDDGSIDKTFGDGGGVVVSSGDFAVPIELEIGADGSILLAVAYDFDDGGAVGVAIGRLFEDGSSDPSLEFQSVMIGFAPLLGWGEIAVRDDGSILFAVSTSGPDGVGVSLFRFDADGSSAPGFGTDGVIEIEQFAPLSMVSMSAGDVLLSGYRFDPETYVDYDRVLVKVLGEYDIVPAAPEQVRLTAGAGSLLVEWSPPVDDGAPRPTSYTVTLQPGGQTCTTSGLSCEFDGLDDAVGYSATVRAENSVGVGPASESSDVVVVTVPTTTVPVTVPVTLPATGGGEGTTTVVFAVMLFAVGCGAAVFGRRRDGARSV